MSEILTLADMRPDNVIDDSNYLDYVRDIKDPNKPGIFGAFQDPGDIGMGACSSEWNGTILSERDCAELIKLHDQNQSSPDHWRLHGNCEILDQNGFPYCWMFGVVGTMQVALAQTGMPNAPHLCATATAARGKNYREQGGWGDEAVGYIQKWGVPDCSVWNEHDKGSDSKWGQESVKRSADMNNIVEFIKLPLDRGKVPEEVLRSVLCAEVEPMPCSAAYNFWGHLIFLSKWLGPLSAKGVNSWKKTWGQEGCVAMNGGKCLPNEAIAIRAVKPRVAA